MDHLQDNENNLQKKIDEKLSNSDDTDNKSSDTDLNNQQNELLREASVTPDLLDEETEVSKEKADIVERKNSISSTVEENNSNENFLVEPINNASMEEMSQNFLDEDKDYNNTRENIEQNDDLLCDAEIEAITTENQVEINKSGDDRSDSCTPDLEELNKENEDSVKKNFAETISKKFVDLGELRSNECTPELEESNEGTDNRIMDAETLKVNVDELTKKCDETEGRNGTIKENLEIRSNQTTPDLNEENATDSDRIMDEDTMKINVDELMMKCKEQDKLRSNQTTPDLDDDVNDKILDEPTMKITLETVSEEKSSKNTDKHEDVFIGTTQKTFEDENAEVFDIATQKINTSANSTKVLDDKDEDLSFLGPTQKLERMFAEETMSDSMFVAPTQKMFETPQLKNLRNQERKCPESQDIFDVCTQKVEEESKNKISNK